MTRAPWTPEQVAALNAYQELGFVHEFTCGNQHSGDRTLVATTDGWRCPNCSYAQGWAHDWMADKAKHPKNPLELLGEQ